MDLRILKSQFLKRKERKKMLKNLVISLLANGLLFTNTIYGQYGWLAYIALSALLFAGLCYLEYALEQEQKKYKAWKKFQRTVNRKIALNQPTKVS